MADIKTNITEQISRIDDAASTIKKKTVELGLVKDAETDGAGVVSLEDKLDIQARSIANITTKSSETIIPGTSDKTISSEQYLTGVQTIKAVELDIDADQLVKNNTASIKSNGTTVVSVSGNLTVNKYITGSEVPTESTEAEDGDLYLVI